MTRARLIMPGDEDAVLTAMEEHAAEARPGMDFRADKAVQQIRNSLTTGDPTIFVAEREGYLLGYLGARIYDYAFTSGFFVAQEVFYVRSEHRGSRAAVVLIEAYLEWGKSMNARELYFDISNPKRPERALKLIGRFGGVPIGTLVAIPNEAWHGQ